ncbi:MAG TPA: diacylglycerol kinase family protein [Candidatus Krumholzibacteria bacterium]|nr:diacylglycerol kinase family protein [Candidatus Krumholzibacteria bacterium]
MAAKKKSQSALFGALVKRQHKHKALLASLEKSSARLERRKARLQTLEEKIAELEQQLSEPRKGRLGKRSARDGELKRARLIFNPGSGRDDEDNAARLAKLVSCLRAHGIEARVGLKTSGGAARKLAQEAVKAGEKLVIVAGGDGTLGDVAAELAGSSTVMGIVPTGTMNNVARSLGVPLEINDACALIGMGTTRHIDMGRVISNGDSKAEYFLECAGVGVSAIAAMGGQAFEKKHWRIVPKAVRKFFEAKPGPMHVEMDGDVVDAHTQIVTISNAPLMGNQMLAVPGAKMDDGLLDVQVYDGMGNAALVKHFKAALAGTPKEIKTYQVRHVRITSDEAVMVNSDMNVTPEQHVIEMEVVPGALSVIVGNGIGLSVPVESAPDAPTFAEDPPVTTAESAKAPPEPEPVLEDA